uniref:Uncharacterized protein n=1 Tax=Ascaris lumbricoides TaxID=6252 RepID=A0A0M3HJT6_ASCLU
MRNQIFPPLAIHLADKGIEEARDRKTDGCGTFESRMYGQKCIYRTGEQDERRVVEAVALTFQFRISLLFRIYAKVFIYAALMINAYNACN